MCQYDFQASEAADALNGGGGKECIGSSDLGQGIFFFKCVLVNEDLLLIFQERSQYFWEVDCQVNGEDFFKENFRMSRGCFQELCSLLSSLQKETTVFRKAIPLEKRIAVAVYALGSSSEYRTIANLFGIGKSTTCCILLEFCQAVWDTLQPKFLNFFPLVKDTVEDCISGFQKLGFPQCLGAIGKYMLFLYFL